GTLTLLFDCGFSDVEAMRWLFTADDSLPGRPIEAIAAHRCSEVNRRAQALAFGPPRSRRQAAAASARGTALARPCPAAGRPDDGVSAPAPAGAYRPRAPEP